MPFRMRASRRIPKSDGQNENGRKIQPSHHRLHRHPGRLPRHRCRGARPSSGDRREHVHDESAQDPDRVRRHRRRRLRRRAGYRRWRSNRHAPVRLLFRDQPGRLRGDFVEESSACAQGGRCAAVYLRASAQTRSRRRCDRRTFRRRA